jgi:hypothetical protein
MQIPYDPSVIQAQSSRGPSVQWMGVQWLGGFYALPLSCIFAVFKTSQTNTPTPNLDLDIEVYDGAPVFMRSFAQCFELDSSPVAELANEELRWALILNVVGGTPMGCRVHQVLGPFWDELKSESVHHDGHDWRLIQSRGVLHA